MLKLLTAAAIGSALLAAESPFACNRSALTATARKRHFEELGPAVRAAVQNVRELPEGYEFQFPSNPEMVQLLSEWAYGEHLCCPFLDIDLRLEREGGGVWLRLTGRKGAKEFIRLDFGQWFR